MPGSGEAGPAGGPNGDLYLEIKVRNHEVFSRNGDDLLCTLEVAMTDAILGAHTTVPALDGDVDVELRPGPAERRDPHRQGPRRHAGSAARAAATSRSACRS